MKYGERFKKLQEEYAEEKRELTIMTLQDAIKRIMEEDSVKSSSRVKDSRMLYSALQSWSQINASMDLIEQIEETGELDKVLAFFKRIRILAVDELSNKVFKKVEQFVRQGEQKNIISKSSQLRRSSTRIFKVAEEEFKHALLARPQLPAPDDIREVIECLMKSLSEEFKIYIVKKGLPKLVRTIRLLKIDFGQMEHLFGRLVFVAHKVLRTLRKCKSDIDEEIKKQKSHKLSEGLQSEGITNRVFVILSQKIDSRMNTLRIILKRADALELALWVNDATVKLKVSQRLDFRQLNGNAKERIRVVERKMKGILKAVEGTLREALTEFLFETTSQAATGVLSMTLEELDRIGLQSTRNISSSVFQTGAREAGFVLRQIHTAMGKAITRAGKIIHKSFIMDQNTASVLKWQSNRPCPIRLPWELRVLHDACKRPLDVDWRSLLQVEVNELDPDFLVPFQALSLAVGLFDRFHGVIVSLAQSSNDPIKLAIWFISKLPEVYRQMKRFSDSPQSSAKEYSIIIRAELSSHLERLNPDAILALALRDISKRGLEVLNSLQTSLEKRMKKVVLEKLVTASKKALKDLVELDMLLFDTNKAKSMFGMVHLLKKCYGIIPKIERRRAVPDVEQSLTPKEKEIIITLGLQRLSRLVIHTKSRFQRALAGLRSRIEMNTQVTTPHARLAGCIFIMLKPLLLGPSAIQFFMKEWPCKETEMESDWEYSDENCCETCSTDFRSCLRGCANLMCSREIHTLTSRRYLRTKPVKEIDLMFLCQEASFEIEKACGECNFASLDNHGSKYDKLQEPSMGGAPPHTVSLQLTEDEKPLWTSYLAIARFSHLLQTCRRKGVNGLGLYIDLLPDTKYRANAITPRREAAKRKIADAKGFSKPSRIAPSVDDGYQELKSQGWPNHSQSALPSQSETDPSPPTKLSAKNEVTKDGEESEDELPLLEQPVDSKFKPIIAIARQEGFGFIKHWTLSAQDPISKAYVRVSSEMKPSHWLDRKQLFLDLIFAMRRRGFDCNRGIIVKGFRNLNLYYRANQIDGFQDEDGDGENDDIETDKLRELDIDEEFLHFLTTEEEDETLMQFIIILLCGVCVKIVTAGQEHARSSAVLDQLTNSLSGIGDFIDQKLAFIKNLPAVHQPPPSFVSPFPPVLHHVYIKFAIRLGLVCSCRSSAFLSLFWSQP